MAADASRTPLLFDPSAFETFRFLDRELHEDGLVTLRYGLDEELSFTERLRLPVSAALDVREPTAPGGLLALLHWVAGVSYFKLAAPPRVEFDGRPPGATVAALLEALYSEGLGEFAYGNRLAHLPRPSFSPPEAPPGATVAASAAAAAPRDSSAQPGRSNSQPQRVLVPVGGGKDSAVAIEIVRRSGLRRAVLDGGRTPDRTHRHGGGTAVAGGPAASSTRSCAG